MDTFSGARVDFLQPSKNYFQKQGTHEQTDKTQSINLK